MDAQVLINKVGPVARTPSHLGECHRELHQQHVLGLTTHDKYTDPNALIRPKTISKLTALRVYARTRTRTNSLPATAAAGSLTTIGPASTNVQNSSSTQQQQH